eukprot:TRINITY_DN57451_c0_g1_i12.p1 TRINITY_DN57451_c0_g1~~TRINITY_DN57451_c0_g1_i12.p1  ORF type:complete len:593 (-),score=54.28 TRINITY_DN57451_c0_g1_i12:2344-4023(-)
MSDYVSHVMFPARLISETYGGPPMEIKSKEDAIWYIVSYKLTRMALFYTSQVNKAVQSGVQNHAQNWIKPSGPRRPGEGVEECEQGIINAGFHEEGITITFTQLLAGYLIGPNGTSVRDLMRRTGCHVKSYEENIYLGKNVRTRVFILQAEEEQSILLCLDVILAAADRYKELTEGCQQGKYVNRIQKIKGYVFYYYPPPKNVVPNAAGIKGLPPTKQAKVARDLLGFPSTGSYIAYLDSISHQFVKPQQDKVLTQFIRTTLELPSDDIDDVGCIHPGLFPGKIYEEETSKRNNNLDSVVTRFERAMHLKQTMQAAGESEVSKNSGELAEVGSQGVGIPGETMRLAAKYIEENPEMQATFQGMDLAQIQIQVASIMESFGLGQKPTHNTTGVFIKDHQGVDPVVPAPLVYRSSSIGRTSRQCSSTTLDSTISQETDQNLCSIVQNTANEGVEGGKQLPKDPPFRLTPFGERRAIPSSITQLPTSTAQQKAEFINPIDMGLSSNIVDDLKRIVGISLNQNEHSPVQSTLANNPSRGSCLDECRTSSGTATEKVAVSKTQP